MLNFTLEKGDIKDLIYKTAIIRIDIVCKGEIPLL